MLTIASTVRPLEVGMNRIAFLNAVRSWNELGDDVEILVFSKSPEILQLSSSENFHCIQFYRSIVGDRPFFDEFIEVVEELAAHDLILYCTDHLILFGELARAAERISERFPQRLMFVGERWNASVDFMVDFSHDHWEERLWGRTHLGGSLGGPAAKDYVGWRRPLGLKVPNFIMGYPWYDSWLVWAALQAHHPVVDLSAVVRAIHQNHSFEEGSADLRELTPGGQHNLRLGKSLGLGGQGSIYHSSYKLRVSD